MAVKYIPLTNKEKYETPDWGYKPHIIPSINSSVTKSEASAYDSSFKKAEEIVASVANPTGVQVKRSEDEIKENENKKEEVLSNNLADKDSADQKNLSSSKKEDFISTLTPIYEKVLRERGLDTRFAKFLVAQDGLESG